MMVLSSLRCGSLSSRCRWVTQPVGELGSSRQGTHRIGDMFGFVRCEREGILSPAWIRWLDGPPFRHAAESEERGSFAQRFLDPLKASLSLGPGRWVGEHMAVLMTELIGEPGPEVPAHIQPDHGSARAGARQCPRWIVLAGRRLQRDGDRFVVVERGEAVRSGACNSLDVAELRSAPIALVGLYRKTHRAEGEIV
jgi:hypothetical protein